MPITTGLVEVRATSSSPGFEIAISVIIVVVALAEIVVLLAVLVTLETSACSVAGKSAWYRHSVPGVERLATSSRGAGVKSGATPTSILSRGVESSSHGIFAATWPFLIE
jgi:hypothetical protein